MERNNKISKMEKVGETGNGYPKTEEILEDYLIEYSFFRMKQRKNVCISLGNAQDIGGREEQQDSFGYSVMQGENGFAAAILCDGMGGLSNGKEASSYIVNEMLDFLNTEKNHENFMQKMLAKIEEVNHAVYRKSMEAGSLMGSTFALAMIQEDRLLWASIGDSRIYLFRGGELYQINRDHSYYQFLLRQAFYGKTVLEEAEKAEKKDALVSFIGMQGEKWVDYSKNRFRLYSGDKIVICSDGIYQKLDKECLKKNLNQKCQESAVSISKAVMDLKISGQDNMTILVLEYREEK